MRCWGLQIPWSPCLQIPDSHQLGSTNGQSQALTSVERVEVSPNNGLRTRVHHVTSYLQSWMTEDYVFKDQHKLTTVSGWSSRRARKPRSIIWGCGFYVTLQTAIILFNDVHITKWPPAYVYYIGLKTFCCLIEEFLMSLNSKVTKTAGTQKKKSCDWLWSLRTQHCQSATKWQGTTYFNSILKSCCYKLPLSNS